MRLRPLMWEFLHPEMTIDRLGNLQFFLSADDPRSAREQFDSRYAFAGGWQPFNGFTMLTDNNKLHYPGDPPLPPLARTTLRDELILFYPHSWVVIIQPDRTYEVCRMD